MSSIDFLTADVIWLSSNAKITFSQGGATDLQKKVFSSRTMSVFLPSYNDLLAFETFLVSMV